MSLCFWRLEAARDAQPIDAGLPHEVRGDGVVFVHVEGWDEYPAVTCCF